MPVEESGNMLILCDAVSQMTATRISSIRGGPS
jgi:hypothetical protein